MILAVPYLVGMILGGILLCSTLSWAKRVDKETAAFCEKLLTEKIRVVKISDMQGTVHVRKGKSMISLGGTINREMLYISGDTLCLDGRCKSGAGMYMKTSEFETLIVKPEVEMVIAERSDVVVFGNDTIR